MHDHDTLVTTLAQALERDSSPAALRRAISAICAERHVTASRAYAMLVRAAAGLPLEQTRPPAVPAQRGEPPAEPLLAS